MLRYTRSPFLACLLAMTLLAGTSSLAAPSPSQGSATSKTDQGKEKDKRNKDDKKEEKDKPSKQEREYQKIKRYSKELYDKDLDFREEVEEAYRQKQREHSEYAFYINTRDADDQQITRSGDKLKVEDTLYDNPLVQDYVNRVGQSLVPKDSERLYAFKAVLNPIPEARSLSTGTVYISSGLLSMIDNEAQLAYALSHEIGHIEKNHWYEDVMIERGVEQYNEKQERKRKIFGLIGNVVAGPLAGALGGNSLLASFYVAYGLPTLLKLAIPNAVVTWDKAQEDEADQFALSNMLARNYDPREVRNLYANLLRASRRDRRARMGFLGDPDRIIERVVQTDQIVGGLGNALSGQAWVYGSMNLAIQKQQDAEYRAAREETQKQLDALVAAFSGKPGDTGKALNPSSNAGDRLARTDSALKGQLAGELNAKLDSGEIIGTTPEFSAVMAELRRDNGIRAFYYDMFQMSRDNLKESLMIRSNDPQAHFYYGKVLKLTARTPAEKRRALEEFITAIDLDKRRVLPEARLHRALALLQNDATQAKEAIASLKEYVELYQREHAGQLPPNMDAIYDYMHEAGEVIWAARPAINISTKNIDPVVTLPASSARQAEPASSISSGETPAQKPRKSGKP